MRKCSVEYVLMEAGQHLPNSIPLRPTASFYTPQPSTSQIQDRFLCAGADLVPIVA
jgi:hypothetical protein